VGSCFSLDVLFGLMITRCLRRNSVFHVLPVEIFTLFEIHFPFQSVMSAISFKRCNKYFPFDLEKLMAENKINCFPHKFK
jgi:hypothetical protein